MRRRWLRKSAKWTCTIAAAMVVGAAVFSLFRSAYFGYVLKDGSTAIQVELTGGSLRILAIRYYDLMARVNDEGWRISNPSTWRWGMNPPAGTDSRWRGSVGWDNGWWPGAPLFADVTLLYPFLLAAIPAGLLWWKDLRRFGPGRCPKCGYDRAGLAAATTCPECGTPPAPATV
jgi:hypothetical protein